MTTAEATDTAEAEAEAEADAEPEVSDEAAPEPAPDEATDQPGRRSLARLVAVLVTAAAAGALAGYVGNSLLPERYAARSELQYHLRNPDSGDLLREDRRLSTQLVMLRSRVVLAPVAAGAGMTPEQLADRTSASIIDNSEVISVDVEATSREQAATLLSRVVDRYVAMANRGWQNPVQSYLERQLRDVQGQLRAPGLPPPVVGELNQRQNYILGQLDSFQPRDLDDPDSETGPPAKVIVPAYPVPDQVGPTPMFTAAAGAVTASVLVALALLFAAQRRARP